MIWAILFKTDQSCKLWKTILANEDGKCKLCTWTKSVGVMSKMCFAQFAENCLMVALQQGQVKNVGQKFWIGIQEVCLHSSAAIGPKTLEISW